MILVDEKTRIVVQGITGKEGSFHAKRSLEYGTKIVAGVSPGKGGTLVEGVPVFNTVEEAARKQGVNASLVFVPAPFAADAILEAVDANLDLVVCITDGVPVSDMMKVKKYMTGKKTKLVGPNCPGLIAPKVLVRMGIAPVRILKLGNIGVVSRSGSLSYEVIYRLSKKNLGQSTFVGIGGDPIAGINFIDCFRLFEEDLETKLVVMIGEIGGIAEEEAAKFAMEHMKKKVIAFICGLCAPPEKRMGHAGAMIVDGKGSAKEKIEFLRQSGVQVALSLNEIPKIAAKILKKN